MPLGLGLPFPSAGFGSLNRWLRRRFLKVWKKKAVEVLVLVKVL